MLELGDFLLLNSHGTFNEVFWFRKWIKVVGIFIMSEQPPVPINGNYSLYVLIFPAPVGDDTKADGQEEDEKKTDEGKKEPDQQAKMVFTSFFLVLFFPFSPCLSVCCSLKIYSVMSKLSEHISAAFTGLQSEQSRSSFIIAEMLNKTCLCLQ